MLLLALVLVKGCKGPEPEEGTTPVEAERGRKEAGMLEPLLGDVNAHGVPGELAYLQAAPLLQWLSAGLVDCVC